MDPIDSARLDVTRPARMCAAASSVRSQAECEPEDRFVATAAAPPCLSQDPRRLPPGALPVGAVTRSLWEAVDYELQRLPGGSELAARLAPLAERTAAAVGLLATGSPVSCLALLGNLDRRILEQMPDPQGREAYRLASTRAQRYLGVDDRPMAQADPVSVSPDPQTPPARSGYPADVASVPVGRVNFPGAATYVTSRLGPVVPLLDGLGCRDRVRFSNQPVARSLDGLPRVVHAERLNLPISAWNKTVEMLTHEDGTRTLLFADFPGRALMRHFQLLTRHRLENRPDGPSVSTVEDARGYEATYQSLAQLFRARASELKGVRALVVGYEGAFQRDWSAEREGVVSDVSSPWTAETYRLPDGGRVAVLSTPDSFHGEILGQSLRRVVEENPGIQAVYAAGSAGSLHARAPYAMVFPDRIEGRDGSAVPNALSSGTGGGVHRSVTSVMEETPDLLHAWRADQVTTVDMEMGPLAEALAGLQVNVGVCLLATDFPAGAAGSVPVELATQDSSQKYRHISDYPAAVRAHLEQGRPIWTHPLEASAGRSLNALSATNLARQEGWVGAMTASETQLYQRLLAMQPSYSFRMSSARLGRVLDDGVVLSTAQVSALKGAPVKPYTPQVEDDLYGAYDYTFGAVGFGRGGEQYGEIRVVLRPETVSARSFATYRSGWQALESTKRDMAGGALSYAAADPALLQAARERFARWVVAPSQYSKSMALFAVEQVRRKGPEVLSELLAASDDALPALLDKHGIGFLEGKIRGSLNLEDVAWVEIPTGAGDALAHRAGALGLQVRRVG